MGYNFRKFTHSVSYDKYQSPIVKHANPENKIYIVDAESKAIGAKNISPVVEINGVDAVYYLEANIAVILGYQDPDAR